jgi:hypothetical protein
MWTRKGVNNGNKYHMILILKKKNEKEIFVKKRKVLMNW